MAYEQETMFTSRVTGEDLSSYQYYCVGPSSGLAMLDDGDAAFTEGILQNKPQSGESAKIAIGGITKAVALGTIAEGARLKCDGSTGKVTTQSSGESFARALESAVAGQIFSILIRGGYV